MASVSIILGTTGTGKSTSIRGLDPKETVIINVLGKDCPLKEATLFTIARRKPFPSRIF